MLWVSDTSVFVVEREGLGMSAGCIVLYTVWTFAPEKEQGGMSIPLTPRLSTLLN